MYEYIWKIHGELKASSQFIMTELIDNNYKNKKKYNIKERDKLASLSLSLTSSPVQ